MLMPSYTVSEKELIIKPILNETIDVQSASVLFNISPRSIYYWKSNKYCKNKYNRKHKSKINEDLCSSIETFIKNKVFFSAYDILKFVIITLKIQISLSSIYNILKNKLKLSYKKLNRL